jgi:hypothetical protein
MQHKVFLGCFALLLASSVAACADDRPESSSPTGETNQPASVPMDYPPGPYGTSKGSVVARYQFKGFQNPRVESGSMQPIQLADFYNPHADDPGYAPSDATQDDRLFPSGSLYGSNAPKPRALSISVSSVWCGACQKEAKLVLPGKHLFYKPLGGEFMVQLNDGPAPGHAASQQDLLGWTTKFQVNFPATLDPSRQLDALFVTSAYPTNIILDTRTMRIVEVVPGVPNEAYWNLFRDTLLGL